MPVARVATSATSQAVIGKDIIVKGKISGSESLYIEGCVEGSINLPGCLVHLGKSARVTATIAASEVIILGEVRGDINASNRVHIRAGSAVTGKVTAARVCIEDGAFFSGTVEVFTPAIKSAAPSKATSNSMEVFTKVHTKIGEMPLQPIPQLA